MSIIVLTIIGSILSAILSIPILILFSKIVSYFIEINTDVLSCSEKKEVQD